MPDKLLHLVCLNAVELIGPIVYAKLLDRFGSPEGVLSVSRGDLLGVDGVGPKLADGIVAASVSDAEEEIALAERCGVEILTRDQFPPGLRVIDAPPIILYVKGTLEDGDAVAIAIVGSRRCTLYGRSNAERLAYKLARRGVTVVSGMARGIDSAAHRGALEADGRTIAVLGSGLSVIYPAENARLFEEICASGAVVSEFPMRVAPTPGNFPRRNRIISGLSLGVVVVEAAKASGSLITARWALEQGREVFAVPGRAGSVTSKGTHALIKDGAKLVDDVDDIVEEFGELKGVLGEEEPPRAAPVVDGREKRVLDLLCVDEALDIEEVIGRSGLEPSEASGILLQLELMGLIKSLPGKRYVRSQPA